MSMMSLDQVLSPSSLYEASKKDRQKLQPGSVARKNADAEARENAAEKRKDPRARGKARDRAQAKRGEQASTQQRKTRQQATKSRNDASAEAEKGQKNRERIRKKASSTTRKRAGETEAARLARVRASGKKLKGRFRPGGPAFTPDGNKKVDQVGAQLAHCMLALRYKRRKSTMGAWNICRWSLSKHGYLKKAYSEKDTIEKGATKQTQKGVRRSMQHAMEKGPLGGGIKGGGARKYDKFSRMFKAIEKDV